VVGVDAAVDLDRERFAGVFVDDVQQLQHPAVEGAVELEVERPDVIGPLRTQASRRRRRGPKTLPLAPLRRHAQALLTPDPLDLLAVQLPALATQRRPGAPVPPAGMLPSELA